MYFLLYLKIYCVDFMKLMNYDVIINYNYCTVL